ncbi:hypothetical protein [Streptomyces sp. NPDC012888]|uniref:hypothetical protein n=1 Tax=Streptomyces sp. NPDC012888 TaxID=3364855 RepID=UPI0036C8F8B0
MTSDLTVPLPPGTAWATGDTDGISDSATPDGPGPGGEHPGPGAEHPGPGGDHAGPGPGGPPLDAAGLTAALALWPVLGTLVEEGELGLHTPLGAYGLPGPATAHQLLTAGRSPGRDTALTRLAETLGGRPLAALATERVWRPLGMHRTTLTPAPRTTLDDTAAFLGHLLTPGTGPLAPAWIAGSLRIRTGELAPARGLLWRPAPGQGPRRDVWVHHADAGPAALWISPRRRRWAALLAPPTAPPALREAVRDHAFDAAPAA